MMNKQDFKNFIKRVQEIRLSENEKSLLRSKISEFISFNPIRGKIQAPGEKNYLSIFEVRHFAKATALLLIIAVVAGGSGVSYAASNSLPGEKLYNVKVNVNEKIEEGLAFGAEAKMVVQSKNVERRLEETQILVKNNKLNEDTKKIVEDKLDEHIENLTKEMHTLSAEGDVEVVLETTGRLAPVLQAHKDILEKKNEGAETLIAKVESTIKAVEDQENEIIAVVVDAPSEESADATTMSLAIESTDDQIVAKLTKEAQKEIDDLSEEVEKVVDARTKKAKNKIRDIKADLAKLEGYEETVTPAPIETPDEILPIEESKAQETNVPNPSIIPTAQKINTAISGKTETSVEVSEPLIGTKEDAIPETEVSESATIAITPELEVSEPQFDFKAKIKEAENLIDEAERLFERGKYREALSIAQEVNRIAGEIEINQKLKALEIAEKIQETIEDQKAQLLQATK